MSEPLTSASVSYTGGATDRTGRMVAASAVARSAVWSLPIHPDTARMEGAMSPLMMEGERQLLISMTADGRLLLFSSTDRRGEQKTVVQNLETGQQTIIGHPWSTAGAFLTRDRRWLTFSLAPESPVPHALALPDGIKARPFPARARWLTQWDLSRDGALALDAALTEPRSVLLESAQTHDPVPLLVHPELNLYLANFSPDDRWILVTGENGIDPPHLFAVPFRQPYPVPVSDWVDLGEGAFGRWSPSGNRVYFLRDHQGSRCLYTLALHPATKQPAGETEAVLHFHSAWRSPLQLDPGYFRLMVAPDKLIFSLGEAQSNLWLAEP